MKLSTSQLVNLAFGATAVVLLVVAVLAFVAVGDFSRAVAARRVTSERLRLLGEFLSVMKDAETGERGYLLTGQAEFLKPFNDARNEWQARLAMLETAYDDEVEHQAALADLRALASEKMTTAHRAVLKHQQDAKADILAEQETGKAKMDRLRNVIGKLEEHEQSQFDTQNKRTVSLQTLTAGGSGALCLLALGFVGGAVLMLRRDLKGREAAENELRRRRVLLSAVLDSMNEGIAVADESGRMVMFNPAAERMLGRGLTSSPSVEWTREYGVYRADRTTPVPPDELPLVRAVQGETFEFHELYIQPAGSDAGRYIAGAASPLVDEFGTRRGGIVVMRDITSQRHAEQRFQSLLESTPDALVLVDRAGLIRLVNAQTERMFGYERQSLLMQSIELLVPESARAKHPVLREAYFQNPRVRGMGTGLELHGRRADGSELPIEISLSPVEGPEDGLVCAAIRDVTERRRTMEEVRKLNERLEDRVDQRTRELADANQELMQRNQENEMFVYSVSHDLRSPLVNLQGFSQELDGACGRLGEIAARSDVPAAAREALAEIVNGDVEESIHFIRTSVVRLSGIIDALLRLSRAGRVVYQWQVVDANAMVRQVVDAAHATAMKKQAEITVEPLPEVWGDRTAVEQIFANVIQNALHYLTPARPGRIEVGALGDDAPGAPELRTFYVRDNGLGIPPEMHVKIFQVFQRLVPQHAPGEGMGLAVVQRMVERHGGRIWLESAPGAGSTFYFTLPSAAARGTSQTSPALAGERI